MPTTLRRLHKEDASLISEAFSQQGWNKAAKQYQHYYSLQEEGKRDIILAEMAGEFAGYLTIAWESSYLPFKEKDIPEIVDFNVLKKFQRRGIGTMLMDEAERRIKLRTPIAGIGVGITADYGPAHILYIKRGYIPDGRGLIIDSMPVQYGQKLQVSDDIILALTKKL